MSTHCSWQSNNCERVQPHRLTYHAVDERQLFDRVARPGTPELCKDRSSFVPESINESERWIRAEQIEDHILDREACRVQGDIVHQKQAVRDAFRIKLARLSFCCRGIAFIDQPLQAVFLGIISTHVTILPHSQSLQEVPSHTLDQPCTSLYFPAALSQMEGSLSWLSVSSTNSLNQQGTQLSASVALAKR
jgi:hypothetical protein